MIIGILTVGILILTQKDSHLSLTISLCLQFLPDHAASLDFISLKHFANSVKFVKSDNVEMRQHFDMNIFQWMFTSAGTVMQMQSSNPAPM